MFVISINIIDNFHYFLFKYRSQHLKNCLWILSKCWRRWDSTCRLIFNITSHISRILYLAFSIWRFRFVSWFLYLDRFGRKYEYKTCVLMIDCWRTIKNRWMKWSKHKNRSKVKIKNESQIRRWIHNWFRLSIDGNQLRV